MLLPLLLLLLLRESAATAVATKQHRQAPNSHPQLPQWRGAPCHAPEKHQERGYEQEDAGS